MSRGRGRFVALVAACAVWVPAGGIASPGAYPAVSRAVCELQGGIFAEVPGSRECTLEAAGAKTVFSSSGGPVEWVQTSTYGISDPSAEVQLGPATVACSRPAEAASDGWMLACR